MDADQIRTNLDAEAARLAAALAAVDRERAESQAERSTDALADEGLLEREVEASMRAELEAELVEVEAARQRLASGSYGRCQACGDAIGEERLAAVPATRFCIDHEARAELLLDARAVNDAPGAVDAASAAAREAGHHLDLVTDDERLAGLDEGAAADDAVGGAEDAAVHIRQT